MNFFLFCLSGPDYLAFLSFLAALLYRDRLVSRALFFFSGREERPNFVSGLHGSAVPIVVIVCASMFVSTRMFGSVRHVSDALPKHTLTHTSTHLARALVLEGVT